MRTLHYSSALAKLLGGGGGVHCEILLFRYSNTIDAIGVKLLKKKKKNKEQTINTLSVGTFCFAICFC